MFILYDEQRVEYKLLETHGRPNNNSIATFVEVFKNDGKTHMIATFVQEAFGGGGRVLPPRGPPGNFF